MLNPTAIALYLSRSNSNITNELNLRTFEVLAPVEEPLHRADY